MSRLSPTSEIRPPGKPFTPIDFSKTSITNISDERLAQANSQSPLRQLPVPLQPAPVPPASNYIPQDFPKYGCKTYDACIDITHKLGQIRNDILNMRQPIESWTRAVHSAIQTGQYRLEGKIRDIKFTPEQLKALRLRAKQTIKFFEKVGKKSFKGDDYKSFIILCLEKFEKLGTLQKLRKYFRNETNVNVSNYNNTTAHIRHVTLRELRELVKLIDGKLPKV